MAWVAVSTISGGLSLATPIITANRAEDAADKAEKRAKRAAKKDRADARRAAAFAETEGKALGDLGVVDLSVDDDLDEAMQLQKKGRVNSTLSI
jgi:hypothetical protein